MYLFLFITSVAFAIGLISLIIYFYLQDIIHTEKEKGLIYTLLGIFSLISLFASRYFYKKYKSINRPKIYVSTKMEDVVNAVISKKLQEDPGVIQYQKILKK